MDDPLVEDGRMKLRSNILTSFLLHEPQISCYNRLLLAFGSGALSPCTVTYWYQRFETGDYSIKDAERSGRPKIDGLREELEKLIETEPRISLKRLALLTGHCKETVKRIFISELHLKRVTHRWVPHLLSDEQKNLRKKIAIKTLPILLESEKCGFANILTGDESWFYFSYPMGDCWIKEIEDRPLAEKKMIGSRKIMMTIFWNGDGQVFLQPLKEKEHINAAYFVEEVLTPLEKRFLPDACLFPFPQYIHFDNARPHTAKLSQTYISKSSFTLLEHPPYSPDLAPCDFFLFGFIKGKLAGKNFSSPEELQKAITAILSTLDKTVFFSVMKNWIERLRFVIQNGGDYYLKK